MCRRPGLPLLGKTRDTGLRVFRLGVQLCAGLRRLRLAGVADDTVARYRDAARREAQQRLHELAADSGLGADRVRLSTPGGADPWMLIVQEEQEHDCDLVVIGRQGRHAVDEFLLGSTTRMVISEGAADVLVASRRSG